MAGSFGLEDPNAFPPANPNKPRIKTFSCPSCGASVTIRNAGASLSVACENCRAIVDVTNENYKIVSRFKRATEEYNPRFTLGTRGKLFGKEWEVSGFIVRESSGYHWEEYLLFNPYYGYRWLLQDRRHWSFVTPTKRKPHRNSSTVRGVRYGGKYFQLFNMGKASVRFVLGEFYWKVKVDQTVEMTDYICPPEMLSCEQDENEINWALAEYVEPDIIEKAFKSNHRMLKRIGIGPNQPSPDAAIFRGMAPCWAIFAVIAILIQFWAVGKSANAVVTDQSFTFIANGKKNDTTSKVFTIPKDRGNLELNFLADIDNSWFYVAGEMVNDKTGTSYPFEKSVEYYHGYEDGESWTEGGRSSSLMFPEVPGGQYYLNMDTESGGFNSPQTERGFQVIATRDIPGWSNFWLSLLAVSILPIWYLSRKHSTEVSRWSHSDYSPYASSD